MDQPSYFERRRDELHKEWSKQDGQKTYAWLLTIVSGGLFVSNFMGVEGPTNSTLGTLTMGGLIAGGVWLWNIRKETDRISRLTTENNKELDRSEASE